MGMSFGRPCGRSPPAERARSPFGHQQLQHDLYSLLVKRYGKAAAIKEEDFADITLTRDGETVVIEVKTDPRLRHRRKRERLRVDATPLRQVPR